MNLLTNAIKFTSTGSVVLRVRVMEDDEVHEEEANKTQLQSDTTTNTNAADGGEAGLLHAALQHNAARGAPTGRVGGKDADASQGPGKDVLLVGEAKKAAEKKAADKMKTENNGLEKFGKNDYSAARRDNCIRIRFEVQDTGMGMRQEDMDQLFQIFGKLKQTEVANASGCGLGLMISKQLARLMGGDVTVSSVKDVGSTFAIVVQVGVVKKAKRHPGSDRGSSLGSGVSSGASSVSSSEDMVGEYTWTSDSSHTHGSSQANSQQGSTGTSKTSGNSAGWAMPQHSQGRRGNGDEGREGEGGKRLRGDNDKGNKGGFGGLGSTKHKSAVDKCGNTRLLCAEDNRFNAAVLRAFMTGTQMTMDIVENGKLALEVPAAITGASLRQYLLYLTVLDALLDQAYTKSPDAYDW